MTEDEVVGRAAVGHDHRHRRVGEPAQADVARAGASCAATSTDLTVVSYGGPDVGMLCAAGKVQRLVVRLRVARLDPARAALPRGPPVGRRSRTSYDEGMFLLGLQAAAWRVPFLPTRVGLGSDLFRVNPELRTVRSPYPDDGGEELVAVPALHLDAALVHLNRADERGNAPFLGPDLYFDDLFLEARRAVASCRSSGSCPPRTSPTRPATSPGCASAGCSSTAWSRRPNGAHFTSCDPDYARDEAFQKEYALAAASPRRGPTFRAEWLSLPDEADYQAKVPVARRSRSMSRWRRPGPTCAPSPSPSASGATARSSPTRSAPSR